MIFSRKYAAQQNLKKSTRLRQKQGAYYIAILFFRNFIQLLIEFQHSLFSDGRSLAAR